jgi:4'-phosphopantetheinyl transferase
MQSLPRWRVLHRRLELQDGEVHLWLADLNRNRSALLGLAGVLALDECAKASRFRLDRDRQRYIFAHGVLRTILARYLAALPSNLVFRCGSFGKPELASGAVRFNMSHADDLVLCAISRTAEVGVDVERVRLGVDRAIGKWLESPRARGYLEALAPGARRRAFFQGWTRMEASAKAHGKGLLFDQHVLENFLGPPSPVLPPLAGEGTPEERWWLHDFSPRRGYIAAVAARGGPPKLRYWKWRAHDLPVRMTTTSTA